MSYCTWIDYGYGVQLPFVAKGTLIKFAEKHRVFGDWLNNYWTEEELKDDENDATSIIIEYEDSDCGCIGLASMLKDVIADEKHIKLCASEDYDGRWYLLYTPSYPWAKQYMTEEEKAIESEEDIANLFLPYLTELYGEDIPLCDYQEVENGG